MPPFWSHLTRTTPPAGPAVPLAVAKAHLRVEHDADDALITSLVEVATAALEGPHGIGVALLEQSWRLAIDDGWPCAFILPLGPVMAVEAITYEDPDGQAQNLDPALYRAALDRRPASILRTPGAAWPATRRGPSAVFITFKAGFGAASSDIPATLRHALLLMVGHLYAHREITVAGAAVQALPLGYQALIEPYRVGRFG